MSDRSTTILYTCIESPIGDLLLLGDGDALHGIHMLGAPRAIDVSPRWREERFAFAEPQRQLAEYFDGQRTSFQLTLHMHGTPFQRSVWRALQEIEYGQTASYGEIASRVGQPGAARAVGIANSRNPISIVVPCHRVIGADGSLTGYGGGLERKRYLLDLEQGAQRLTSCHGLHDRRGTPPAA